MRVGRGAGRVATIRLHHVARIAASEVASASANGDAFALTRFLQNFAANLQPAPSTTTVSMPQRAAITPGANRPAAVLGPVSDSQQSRSQQSRPSKGRS
jgi:hypothetical protein